MSAKTKRTLISEPSKGRKLNNSPYLPRRLAFQDQYDVPKLRKAIDNNEPSLITWENHTLNSQNFDEPGACPPDWISVFEIYEEIEEWSYSWL